MKFSCYKKDLLVALKGVARAVPIKPSIPSMSGILLRAEDNMLELQANNLSLGIIARIPVNVEIPGVTLVSGKRFADFVAKMPDDTITAEVDGNCLKMDSGGANVELLTLNPDDFPKVNQPASDNHFNIRASVFRELLLKTIFAAGKDESRPIFTGVSFNMRGNVLTCAATNSHRIAVAKAFADIFAHSCEFVVPADSLNAVLSQLPKDDCLVDIRFASRFVTFQFDNIFINSRLIEGQFPPLDKVLAHDTATTAFVDTKEFKAALQFVATLSKQTTYNAVQLSFADNSIEILADSADIGGAVKSVETQITGNSELVICFNVDYLLDATNATNSPKLNLAFNDKYDPVAITEPGNDDWLYIVTPVRTR